MVQFASIECKDNNKQSRIFYNKCSGPLPMVPNICFQLFGTIANGPEHLFLIVRDHCQRSGTFVVGHPGLFVIILIFNEGKLDPFVIELGISILKGIWTEKS